MAVLDSLPDGIRCAAGAVMDCKRAMFGGYGDVGEGCALALRDAGARVLNAEVDPTCALQACMEGFQVVKMESKISESDIVTVVTGSFRIITLDV